MNGKDWETHPHTHTHTWWHVRLSCPRQLLHILSVFGVALTPDSQAPTPLRPDWWAVKGTVGNLRLPSGFWGKLKMVALVTHMCNFARLFNFSSVFAVTLPCDVLFYNGRESAGASISLVLLHFWCAFRRIFSFTCLFSWRSGVSLALDVFDLTENGGEGTHGMEICESLISRSVLVEIILFGALLKVFWRSSNLHTDLCEEEPTCLPPTR